jgi:hypothetical protein
VLESLEHFLITQRNSWSKRHYFTNSSSSISIAVSSFFSLLSLLCIYSHSRGVCSGECRVIHSRLKLVLQITINLKKKKKSARKQRGTVRTENKDRMLHRTHESGRNTRSQIRLTPWGKFAE